MSLAARGARNMDNGVETIQDDLIKKQIRRQARKVQLEGTLVAAVLTIAVMLIP